MDWTVIAEEHLTWLNRYESRLSLESCLPGEFLSPEQRSCVPVKSGFYASEYNHNSWMIMEKPLLWLESEPK